ncbi:MAG: 30S ribosomal protein S17, partial [Deltaproteobacteria bacterium]|nr:30S ribosomal protein S17 [Deltaproteobacteria bacterium]
MRQLIKRREGKVVSAKMNKTVVVQVERLVEHRLYGKRLKQRTRGRRRERKLRRASAAGAQRSRNEDGDGRGAGHFGRG